MSHFFTLIPEGRLNIMKMKYAKPMVLVDRYELSQAIASCLVNVQFTNSSCFLNTPGIPAQMKELAATGWFIDGCVIMTEEGTTFDGICIHTAANGAVTSN